MRDGQPHQQILDRVVAYSRRVAQLAEREPSVIMKNLTEEEHERLRSCIFVKRRTPEQLQEAIVLAQRSVGREFNETEGLWRFRDLDNLAAGMRKRAQRVMDKTNEALIKALNVQVLEIRARVLERQKEVSRVLSNVKQGLVD